MKLWKCGEGFRKLEHLLDIPLVWMNGQAGNSGAGLEGLSAGAPFLGSRRSPWEPLTLPGPFTLPCPRQVGFVNSLKFSAAGDFLVAGTGQEHRYCPLSLMLLGGTASPSSGSHWRVTPAPVSSTGWDGGGESKKPKTVSASSP